MKTLLLILFISINEAFCSSIYIITNKPHQESIYTIVEKFTPIYDLQIANRTQAYKRYLQVWNPHVPNWNNIPSGTKIFIESPSLPMAGEEVAPLYHNASRSADDEIIEGTKLYFLLTSSQGNSQDKLPASTTANISSIQSSPYTLELASNTYFINSDNHLDLNAYWSKLNPVTLSVSNSAVTTRSISSEYGIYSHLGHQFSSSFRLSYFGGVDFENFSTYNLIPFLAGAEFDFVQNKLLSATIGLEQVSYFNDHQINFKLSLARSLSSTTSSANSTDRYAGYRINFFTNYHLFNRTYCHFIYKRYQLTGPTDLTINRYGIGLSLTLF